ncbi:hypothetical protein [Candidatus Planktophila dulcis]|uniref:hypothetical protein n=1 Tax=Candidatus Planktophila dulcis TaxID=1884914 RepID=UPI003CF927BB
MSQIPKWVSSRWYLLVGILTAYIYFRVAPLQVDPHHDGVILGAAVAVAEGRPILSGAFSQYGPLPALIQGFVLWLFNTQLLTLRLMTAVQCLVIGFAIYKLTRKFAQENLSKLLSFFWLLTSCIWVTQFPGALLPWPSLLSTMLVMYGMILLIESAKKSNRGWAFAAGSLFGLAGFCRIQAFAVLPLILIVGVLQYRKESKVLISSLVGYFSSLAAMALYLLSIGSMDDFIQQGIITPLFAYSDVGQGNNYNRFQFVLYIIEAIGFACLYIFTRGVNKRNLNSFSAVSIVTACLFAIGYLGTWVANSSIPIRYRVLIGEPLQNLLISPFYFATVASAILAALVLLRNHKGIKQFNFAEAIVIFTAFGTLPQLYPQPDIMHLWWIAPIYLCCISIVLKRLPNKFSTHSSRILNTILISCICLGAISASQFIYRPWVEYKLGVLKGTYAHEEKAKSLDIFRKIENVAIAGETSFDCPDGVYSVANGTYLAADQWFVNWGFGDEVQPKIGKIRIICDQSRDYANSESAKLTMGLFYYKSNVEGKSIAILKKNG